MFYIVEAVGYISFLLLDILHIYSAMIKYGCVVICLLYSIHRYIKGYSLLQSIIMLCLITIADYYLLFTYQYKIGVFLFCLVQCCYSKTLYPKLKCSIIVFLYSIFFFLFTIEILVCLYAFHSISNLVSASYQYLDDKTRNRLFLVLAILLLLLCDICVALQWLRDYVSSITVMIWFFYLPSLWFLLESYEDTQYSILGGELI